MIIQICVSPRIASKQQGAETDFEIELLRQRGAGEMAQGLRALFPEDSRAYEVSGDPVPSSGL